MEKRSIFRKYVDLFLDMHRSTTPVFEEFLDSIVFLPYPVLYDIMEIPTEALVKTDLEVYSPVPFGGYEPPVRRLKGRTRIQIRDVESRDVILNKEEALSAVENGIAFLSDSGRPLVIRDHKSIDDYGREVHFVSDGPNIIGDVVIQGMEMEPAKK